MALAGMNVARINMSHGTYEEHQVKVDNIKKVRRALGMPIPIMVDTKGPEVRIGTFANGKIDVVEGMKFDFVNTPVVGDETRVSVTYPDLHKDIAVGSDLLLNDGLLIFKVVGIENGTIHTVAQNSGVLADRKGLFAPMQNSTCRFCPSRTKRTWILA